MPQRPLRLVALCGVTAIAAACDDVIVGGGAFTTQANGVWDLNREDTAVDLRATFFGTGGPAPLPHNGRLHTPGGAVGEFRHGLTREGSRRRLPPKLAKARVLERSPLRRGAPAESARTLGPGLEIAPGRLW